MFALMPSAIYLNSKTKFTAAYWNKSNISGITCQKAFKLYGISD